MIRRRDFITVLSGAGVTWPLTARGQQRPISVIGFLNSSSPGGYQPEITGFRGGLAESGYVEGRDVAIEFRWAQEQYGRLPMLAADLVQRRVAVIVASGSVVSPLAAKAATSTIPIVFTTGSDPVEQGLVPGLARPGGNITGVTTLGRELLAKRLELLREILPSVSTIGLLVNPSNPNTEPSVSELQALARAGGWTLHVAEVRTDSDLDAAFANLAQLGARGHFHSTDALFNARRIEMVVLAARHGMPGIYQQRDAVEAGGLMSYGASRPEIFRTAGIYTGRILKGEKPADLPVQQSAKVELIINLKTARALGLTVPDSLLARADEVIE